MQIYAANWCDDSTTGSHGILYSKHADIALETQNFPDAPNHANFPSAVLSPGETYAATTI